jgi:hypothetical protein
VKGLAEVLTVNRGFYTDPCHMAIRLVSYLVRLASTLSTAVSNFQNVMVVFRSESEDLAAH